ncbi:MAG: IPT/TIG domain-containing protein [Treponema sp.]|nr:IPT/TIG domain-containing protein [Treponema sp.]
MGLLPNKSNRYALLGLILLAGCQAKAPVIYSVYPQIGNMGEPITIYGSFFGERRDESYVTIAGAQPTSMSYLEWLNYKITLRVPEFGEAGLVYVYVDGKKSNGVLFANQAAMPRRLQDGEGGLGPRIVTVTPLSGTTGTPVNISGSGFGTSRGSGGVYFSWNAEIPASAPAGARLQEYAEVSETDFGYELWTDREIRVYVPDGAVSGNMEVRTAKGSSPPLFFDLAGKPGTKIFRDKRIYTIGYSVNVKTGEAEQPNTLYLWIPRPAVSPAQRNLELLSSSMEPFVESYRGTCLYKIDNLAANSDVHINLSWKVEVYGVETALKPQSIKQEANSPVSAANIQSGPNLPSDDPRIKSLAASILGRERNPYVRAQRIYEWMLDGNIAFENVQAGDVLSALEEKKADAYLSVLLYCTLLRAADIPCLPVSGVLVSRDRQTMNHYWAEFWVDSFGWIPADPAMGAGAIPAPFSVNPGTQERADFYFGNIDSQRIAFSRGFINLSPMDPRGRTVVHSRSFSLQNLWEEVVGSVEAYSSLWGDVTITGIYAQ